MSQAGSQAWAFYREVARTRVVWTICDDVGFPAPMTSSGKRVQPFWSSRSRAERIIKTVSAYTGFEPYEGSWDDFCREWAMEFADADLLVGVNWSGKRAIGFDLEPQRLVDFVQAVNDRPQ